MLDSLLKSTEINGLMGVEFTMLLGFLMLAIVLLFVIRNEYVFQKILGWIMIISFFLAFIAFQYLGFFVVSIGMLFAVLILATREFVKLLNYDFKIKIGIGAVFAFLMFFYLSFVFGAIGDFIWLFVFVSFSDIVAYFVGKGLPWKRGFTSLSPNKALSGVIGQIVFLFVALVIYFNFTSTYGPVFYSFLALVIAVFAPVGDLMESYFKRKAGVKDTADYIPGHGGILDRVDSSFVGVNIVNFLLMFK